MYDRFIGKLFLSSYRVKEIDIIDANNLVYRTKGKIVFFFFSLWVNYARNMPLQLVIAV